MAQDKRDYLISLGLAKEGRGKFSNAAHEALRAAEADGMIFHTASSTTSTVAVLGDSGKVTMETRDVNPYAPHALAIREGQLTFGKGKSKVTVSASNACHHCSFSFGWCWCDEPTFLYWKTGAILSLNQ